MMLPADTHYAYAVGRIKALEKKMLDRSKIERMLEAKTLDDAMKIIAEAGYMTGITEDASAFEGVLKAEYSNVFSLIKEIAPDPSVFDAFLLMNDYHNAKVLLKAEFSDQTSDELLLDTGTIPARELAFMIKSRNMQDMPENMRTSIKECIDLYNRTGDPQTIDMILDRYGFRHIREAAQKTGSRFISDLVTIRIDLINIKTFLRVKRLNRYRNLLQDFILRGGSIDSGFFFEKLETPLESFVEATRHMPYGQIVESGVDALNRNNGLTEFERLSDDYITGYLNKNRFIILGVEPLVGFLLGKETEIKNIRIIMVGKFNNIATDIIRERLRESYV